MIQEDYNNLNMILDECRDLNGTVSNYTEPCTFHYHAPLLDQLDIAVIRVIIFYFLKFENPIEKIYPSSEFNLLFRIEFRLVKKIQ